MTNEMRLIDAPAGLFRYCGYLGFKTEYMMNGCVEAYVVASGERFWAGVKTPKELNNLLVTPVDPYNLRPAARKGRSTVSKTGLKCTNCYSDVDLDAVYCKYCGAKMED